MEQTTFKIHGNKTYFSCGCVTEIIGKNYVMIPCSPDCEIYLYTIEQSKLQGNIISYMFTNKGGQK